MARQHIFTDAQVPTGAPMFLGDHFVNTANAETYFSTLTGDVSGWVGMVGHNKGLGENTPILSFDSSMTFPEMQVEIDRISNRHNKNDALLIEFATGTYISSPSDQPLTFEGFVGRAILIYGDTPISSSTSQTVIINYTGATNTQAPIIDIDSCNCPFDIRYIRFLGNDNRGMINVTESTGVLFLIGCSFVGTTTTSEIFTSNAHADTVSMLYNRYDRSVLFNVDDANIRLFDTLPSTIIPTTIGYCDNSNINFDNSFIETPLGVQATNNNNFDINIATVIGDVTHDIFGYGRTYVCDNTTPIVITIADDVTFDADSPVNFFGVFQGNTGTVTISGGNTANLVGSPHTLAGQGDFRQVKRLNANRWEVTNSTVPLSAILDRNNKTNGFDIELTHNDAIIGEPDALVTQGGATIIKGGEATTASGQGGTTLIKGGDSIGVTGLGGDIRIDGGSGALIGGEVLVGADTNTSVVRLGNGSDDVNIHGITYPVITGSENEVMALNGAGDLVFTSVGSITPTSPLSAVLVDGNITNGSDIIITHGDRILGELSGNANQGGDITVKSGFGGTIGGALNIEGGNTGVGIGGELSLQAGFGTTRGIINIGDQAASEINIGSFSLSTNEVKIHNISYPNVGEGATIGTVMAVTASEELSLVDINTVAPTLSAVLGTGNVTNGTDIEITHGDLIIGETDGAGVNGGDVIIKGGISTAGLGGNVTIESSDDGKINMGISPETGAIAIGSSTPAINVVRIHNVTYPDATNASAIGDVGKVLRVNGIGLTEFESLPANDVVFDGTDLGLTTTDVSGTLLEIGGNRFSVIVGASSSKIIDSFVPTIERSSKYDYVLFNDGVASRAGEVRCVFDPTNTNIDFFETTTNDITSTTSAVVLDVIFTGSAIEFRAINSGGSAWVVAGKREKF